jgi:putative transposase
MMSRFHGENLRKGRASQREQIYLITTVTKNREPCFSDLVVGRTIVNSLRWCDDNGLSETWCFVVMPDHLHWLMGLSGNTPLSKLIGAMKRFTSGQTSQLRKRPGALWQRGFHDHAIRREEDLRAVARYVVFNPVRAGIVTRLGDYPLWDAKWL